MGSSGLGSVLREVLGQGLSCGKFWIRVCPAGVPRLGSVLPEVLGQGLSQWVCVLGQGLSCGEGS